MLHLEKVAPFYLSEIASPKWRGALSTGFPFFLGLGIIAADCINNGTAEHTWRLSLGLAVVLASVMTIGASEERDKIERAEKALRIIKGSSIDIEPEFEEHIKSTQIVKSVKKDPFKTILKREYQPQILMALAISCFEHVTGNNIVAFYSPNLFSSLGLGHDDAASISTIILEVITVFIVLTVVPGVDGTNDISKGNAILILVLICFCAAGLDLSWSPLTWLIPTEIFPIYIGSIRQSIAVVVHFIMVFVLSQTFLTMLCQLYFGAILFYAGWVFFFF
ncbi:putative major facilitator, sugar transporter, major facilitator superfamily [Medicago truncatula]|uniref:Putative major facilitator, sugar transporter, major facilitator superfamily n=1 Tax=Medicago truncatula TaxID=3880 RepID=A0A396IW64_MEDTR|nr:putative major facilitator, sugar transporter, major facilitator superfamily [Medicago truncatula]